MDHKVLEKRLSLQKVSTNFYQNNRTQEWKEDFNQATIFNYDPVNPLYITKWVLPPAVTIAGNVYPTFLAICLNVGEINDSNYVIDTKNSTTANWQVIYNQYLGVE